MMGMQYTICQWATNRFRPSELTKHHHRCPLTGGALSHHCSLAMFENLEVFFVSLSLLSLCFVIIIKYSRAQRGTQASHPHHLSLCCSRA